MKTYVSPIIEIVEFKANDIMTQSGGPCNDNIPCPQDTECPTFVCPTMYGQACSSNPYN